MSRSSAKMCNSAIGSPLTFRLRRCERIGFGHNMSHNIFIILRKTGVGFVAFSVSWHFFTPSQARRGHGIQYETEPEYRRRLHRACSAAPKGPAGQESESGEPAFFSGHPQLRVRLVIGVPHGGGLGGVEQNIGIQGTYVTIAKQQIVSLPVPCRVKSIVQGFRL